MLNSDSFYSKHFLSQGFCTSHVTERHDCAPLSVSYCLQHLVTTIGPHGLVKPLTKKEKNNVTALYTLFHSQKNLIFVQFSAFGKDMNAISLNCGDIWR